MIKKKRISRGKFFALAGALCAAVALAFAGCSNALSGGGGSGDTPARAISLSSGFKIVGYSASWRGTADEIQFDKLTHVIYAFAIPNTAGNIISLENTSKLQSIVSKAHAKGVKVSLAVGGWSYNGAELDGTFEQLAASPSARTNLVNNLVSLVNQYGLDGVDMDWEYPDAGTSSETNYVALMTELSQAMHSRGKLLSAAVVAQGWTANAVTSAVINAVDFLNVMAYDGDAGAGHSPMSYATSALDYWLTQRGAPSSKINLGVPFYARPSWRAYDELVPLAPSVVPYTDYYNGDYYNGIPTIQAKTQLAMDRAGGIMIWELSHDTNDGTSLLSAIYQKAGGGTVNPGDTSAPSVPSGLTVKSATSSSLAISWSASTDNVGVSGYKIAVNGSQYMTASGTSATVSGLSADTSYSISVAAYDAAGNSSAYGAAVTGKTAASTVPTDGPATGVPGTPSLSQNKWNGEADYTITMDMWWGNNGTLFELLENGAVVASRALTDASPTAQRVAVAFSGKANGSYAYQCRLTNRFGTTASGTLTYTVTKGGTGNTTADTQAPTAPGSVTAGSVSQTGATISWTASSDNVGVTGYRVKKNGSLVATVTGTSHSLSGLTAATSYAISVTAVDAAGNESAGSSVSFTTLASTGGDTGGTEWVLNGSYVAGQVVTYQGSSYKCLVTHVAYATNWNPAEAPTLWQKL